MPESTGLIGAKVSGLLLRLFCKIIIAVLPPSRGRYQCEILAQRNSFVFLIRKGSDTHLILNKGAREASREHKINASHSPNPLERTKPLNPLCYG